MFVVMTDTGATVDFVGIAIGVLQQILQIFVCGSFTNVQNSHVHSKSGGDGGGPTGPWSGGPSAITSTGSFFIMFMISGSIDSASDLAGLAVVAAGRSGEGFNDVTMGLVASCTFASLGFQKSLELSSTDEC